MDKEDIDFDQKVDMKLDKDLKNKDDDEATRVGSAQMNGLHSKNKESIDSAGPLIVAAGSGVDTRSGSVQRKITNSYKPTANPVKKVNSGKSPIKRTDSITSSPTKSERGGTLGMKKQTSSGRRETLFQKN